MLGLIVGVVALFKVSIDVRRRAKWRHVISAIKKLDGRIRHYNLDVVIGLSDGLVPAGILALNYRISEIYFINSPVGRRLPCNLSHIPDLSGKNVLLIDNHIYTGSSMREAAAALALKNPAQIVTIALFRHTVATAVFTPDHFVYTVNGKVRSVPWGTTPEHRGDYLS
ncbi:phosphoribosyltransferase family protein [Streptomyces albogriseolus]|uniref:phosphoribosyltransferase family protein n=1 Tax=Streptomyces albogriseolus TaxID=1887 RepID=UPI0036E9F472